jgi:DNA sulfur modification protein DndD
MHLLNLTIHNWGVFRGRHDFNLAPAHPSDGAHRHLTIVCGPNGAGKTTLFQALALALHGRLALSDRMSHQAYSDFLLNRLHRYNKNGTSATADEGDVALTFQYIQSGRPLRIQVERRWERRGQNVSETLTVLQDGEPPDVDPAEYQNWLNDLVPPGLAPLCFFDAEHLNALASPEQHDGLLGETLRRLLGLDVVERLRGDLEHYTLRRGGTRKADRLRQEIVQQQAAVDALSAQLSQLRTEAKALADERAKLEAALTHQEHRLAAEGGTYAARRPALKQQLALVQKEIESLNEQLGELSAGLLPFALVRELCQTLSLRLAQEAELRRGQIAGEFWQERITTLEFALKGDSLWKGLNVPEKVRRTIVNRLVRLLRKTATANAAGHQPLVHHLAEREQQRLQEWIAQALHTVPQQVQALGARLRALQAERRQIERDLQRAPDDELLAPLRAEIARLETALADVRKQQVVLNDRITKLEFQRDEQARQLQRTADELAIAQAHERQLALAERSKLALRVFEDALTRERLGALEEALVSAFNTICRKEHLLTAARINPDNFHIQLQGADGHILDVGDLSAGERQLYALALLWALRRVSGRQLPLVVDTPLARLDEIHRFRLIHTYIPAVSNQVLLFATDAELDAGLLAQAEPYVARIYRLEYDSESEATMVTCDHQLAAQGTVLRRGETHGEPVNKAKVLYGIQPRLRK